MTWVTPVTTWGPFQVPFFIAGYSFVGGTLGGVEHDKDGFCNAVANIIGTSTSTRTYTVASVPYSITQVRVYAATDGTAPSGVNLKVGLWWGGYQGRNLGSITPDGLATIPLSSLPVVSAANNYTCHALPSPTIATLPTSLSQTLDNQFLTLGLYLDNGFVATSGVILGCVGLTVAAAATNNSLDFTSYSGSVIKEWQDLPDQTCAANDQFKVSPIDLNVVPAARPSRNWAAVIG